MSGKLEEELSSLLMKRFVDDPWKHPDMFRVFFESNKNELQNQEIWDEIKVYASEELVYKVQQGESQVVDDFMTDLKFHYAIWHRN